MFDSFEAGYRQDKSGLEVALGQASKGKAESQIQMRRSGL